LIRAKRVNIQHERSNLMKTKINLRNVISLSVSLTILFFISAIIVPPSYGAKKTKEIELTFSSFAPVGYPYLYDINKLFVDMVNKRGKGIVRLNSYYGGTLLRGDQALPGLQAGTADMIFVVCGRAAGVLPVLGLWNIPVWDSMASASEALKFGSPAMKIINEHIARKNFYMLPTGNAIEYIFTKKIVRTVPDLKGLKIRASGKAEGRAIQALGATPVVMPSSDIPQSLQRNIIDGVLISPHTAQGRKIEEFTKSLLIYPVAFQGGGILFAKDKWDRLPENVRKVFTDVAKEWDGKAIGHSEEAILSESQIKTTLVPIYEKAGLKVIYPSAEEVNAFKKALEPVAKWWAKKVGKDVSDELLKYTDYKQ